MGLLEPVLTRLDCCVAVVVGWGSLTMLARSESSDEEIRTFWKPERSQEPFEFGLEMTMASILYSLRGISLLKNRDGEVSFHRM